MTEKQEKDRMILYASIHNFNEDKDTALMLVARGCITLQHYQKQLTDIEHAMNARQFRYINKYQIIDEALSTKKFQLTPDDLGKFNYN
jgi:hypothetical protein